jgi:hypothetical protein
MRQLEMRVAVDEARKQIGVGEMQRLHAAGFRHTRVRPDGGDSARGVNKNGAVLK